MTKIFYTDETDVQFFCQKCRKITCHMLGEYQYPETNNCSIVCRDCYILTMIGTTEYHNAWIGIIKEEIFL